MKMNRAYRRAPIIALIVLTLGVMLAAGGSQSATPTPAGEPAAASPTVQPESTSEPTSEPTPEPESTAGAAAAQVASTVTSRTPVPTPTLSPVDQKINEFVESTGVAGDTFLGLTATDWINIVISALIVAIGYLLGGRLLLYALRWFAGRTAITLDNDLLKEIGQELQWFVFLVFVRFAIMRLDFIKGGIRTLLDDVFFVALLVIVTIGALKLVNFAVQTYMANYVAKDEQVKLDAVMTMIRRLGYFFVLIVALSIGMDHFGFQVNVLTAVLIVFGVIVALGAKDMVSDIISGFIILVDQPFRVGDTILIEKLNTAGTVPVTNVK